MSEHDSDGAAAAHGGGDEVEVSYAGVAAEDADESVAHETESLADPDTGLDTAPGADADADDTPPEQPTISSMLGAGPVGEGDDAVV